MDSVIYFSWGSFIPSSFLSPLDWVPDSRTPHVDSAMIYNTIELNAKLLLGLCVWNLSQRLTRNVAYNCANYL